MLFPQSEHYQLFEPYEAPHDPANNGVGGVVIAGAVIADVGMAQGVGLALLSPFTNAGGNGNSDICRFRYPAGGVVS